MNSYFCVVKHQTWMKAYCSVFVCVCVYVHPSTHTSTRSSSSVLMNLMMSDENNRDIYITIASMPPPKPCSQCCPLPSISTIRTGTPLKPPGNTLHKDLGQTPTFSSSIMFTTAEDNSRFTKGPMFLLHPCSEPILFGYWLFCRFFSHLYVRYPMGDS